MALVTVVADQGSKWWALHSLTPGDPVPLVGSWLQLSLIRNPGAAFSLGDGRTWLLTVIAVVVAGFVALAARRVGSAAWALAFGLILGGAVGNLIDRFLRGPGPGRGHVVDFIDYAGLFVGNVADIAIVVAAGVVAWLSLRGSRVDGGRATHEGGARHVGRRADARGTEGPTTGARDE